MSTFRSLVAIVAASACLASCSVSSESFVTDISGYSVTRGRITQVEDMHAHEIQPLTDGVALTLSRPGCRVSLLFDNSETRVIEVEEGTILVYGYDNDYVLKTEPEWSSQTTPTMPPPAPVPDSDRE